MVGSLSTVGADILIGLDIISTSGGVKLQYDSENGVLTDVVFGPGGTPTVAAAAASDATASETPRHVTVVQDGADATLVMSDGEAYFDSQDKTGQVKW